MLDRFRLRAATLLLPVLLVFSAGCDIAMADHRQSETAEWRKTYELAPGGRLEVGNVNGTVTVKAAEGNVVEVVARKIAKAPTPEAAKEGLSRIEIKEETSPSGVKIETKLLKTRDGLFGLFDGGNLQVEYTIRVPKHIEVYATTVNGGVEIDGVAGRVTAEATNGGIKAREVAGPITATTTNGGVDVELAKVTEAGVKLECTNGGIKLSLPSDAKASISARITNGGIETSGLTLDEASKTRRRLDGRLNGGGPRIDLEGVNGGIRIAAR